MGPVGLAQQATWRQKVFACPADTVQLDVWSIVPGSFSVFTRQGIPVDSQYYSIDYVLPVLIWKGPCPDDSLQCRYQVLPLSLGRQYFHKTFEQYDKSDSIMQSRIIYAPYERLSSSALSEQLDYSGNYTRGIAFGNNQDLVATSSFNLRLQGTIARDVEVVAAMSDQNIPIQPEGNTQQIQDFDRIYIQFTKDRSSLVLGDYELTKPDGYFLNYHKKLQGVRVQSAYRGSPGSTWTSEMSAAAARGKYVRQSFQGVEGNQGPYRLTGSNNETFIMILAGTERVYIDGKLMERGFDHDYVIDYNVGEITFMPRQLITKDKRIVVEFQIADRAYLRTVFTAGQQLQSDRLTLRVRMYNEQDARNQPLQQVLTDEQKAFLANWDPAEQQSPLFPGADSVGFRTDRPMYRKTDSLGYVVYVYSTDPAVAHYDVRFSYVGSGQGNYRISSASVNGRIYYWVAPVNGQPQGDFEPVVRLTAPQRIQVISAGGQYALSKTATVQAEVALANHDANTFANQVDTQGPGVATVVMLQKKHPVRVGQKPSELQWSGRYELLSERFKPVEPFRPVEFARDWNLTGTDEPTEEHMASLRADWRFDDQRRLQVITDLLARPGSYQGLKNTFTASYGLKGLTTSTYVSWLVAQTDTFESRFLRPTLELAQRLRPFGGMKLGLRFMQEQNRIFQETHTQLLAQSFYWNEGSLFVQSGDTATLRWRLSLTSRTDHVPRDGSFRKATVGNSGEGGFTLVRTPTSQLEVTATYRNLTVADSSLTDAHDERTLIVRSRYDFSMRNGFLVSNTFYETSSGQVPKLEYAFAPVAAGTGTHMWIDYNEDGIQQINEFEVAPFASDGAFVKIFLPTGSFVASTATQVNQSLSLSPGQLFSSSAGWQSWLARFSLFVNGQVDKRMYRSQLWTQLNPLPAEVADSLLIASATAGSATLYFNRTDPRFGMDVTLQGSRSKSLLTNGVESRQQWQPASRVRWNLTRQFSVVAAVQRIDRRYTLAFQSSHNYHIRGYELSPKLSFMPRNTLRLSVNYRYADQRDVVGEPGSHSRSHQLEGEIRLHTIGKSSLTAKTTVASVTLDGKASSPAGYAMLMGLQPGWNVLGSIVFEQRLSKFLEMVLSYEGRQTGAMRWIHTGRTTVRAVF